MHAATASVCALLAAGCVARVPPVPVAEQLALAERALREGRLEEASERIAEARRRDPLDHAPVLWEATLADLTWRDDDAVRAMQLAIRTARARGEPPAEVAALEGQLGDLLFRCGRWGECGPALIAGAAVADGERRRAFAATAAVLPFVQKVSGPLLSEQPLRADDVPEFLCGSHDRQRPFHIDTGAAMTMLADSLAVELGVQQRWAAGEASGSIGNRFPVELGVLPKLEVGEIEVGDMPVLVADDAVMRLRDLRGGPERAPLGVLGLDVLSLFRLMLDPERASVVLELPRGLPPEQSVQCVRDAGACLVPVLVDDVRMWFVLDTGASHSSLSPAGLERLPRGAARAVPAFREVRTLGGSIPAVREVHDLVMRCSEARFVGVTLPVVPRGATGLFPVHGVLGVDLLGHCRVILDRGRARLIALP